MVVADRTGGDSDKEVGSPSGSVVDGVDAAPQDSVADLEAKARRRQVQRAKKVLRVLSV